MRSSGHLTTSFLVILFRNRNNVKCVNVGRLVEPLVLFMLLVARLNKRGASQIVWEKWQPAWLCEVVIGFGHQHLLGYAISPPVVFQFCQGSQTLCVLLVWRAEWSLGLDSCCLEPPGRSWSGVELRLMEGLLFGETPSMGRDEVLFDVETTF